MRRSLATLTVVVALGGVVGCGSDSEDGGGIDAPTSSEPEGDQESLGVAFSLVGPAHSVEGEVAAAFTASGVAVEDGVLCASGTARDGGSLGEHRVLGRWLMECDDGSGSFTLELVMGSSSKSGDRTGFSYEWEIEKGAGDYEGMSGGGTGTADCAGGECRDDYEGSVQWGTPPASPVTTSASADEATSTSYDPATVFEEWDISETVCLREPGDQELLDAAVDEAARRVEQLAGRYVSGWPTTTMQSPAEHEEWERDILRGGIQALALAMLADGEEAVLQRWGDYEASYADPDGQWGPIWTISQRVDEWIAPADAVAEAVREACADP
jgi:hypothetical protein